MFEHFSYCSTVRRGISCSLNEAQLMSTGYRESLRSPHRTARGRCVEYVTDANLSWSTGKNNFDDLVIFGDSYSDTGNAFRRSNNTFPPSPPYFEGRLSNGPIWVDQIASELSLGEDDIQNFAFAGATSGRKVFVPEGTNIIEEEPGFTSELPGLLDQVDQFAAGVGKDGADPDDIYFIWMNGNDFQLTNPNNFSDARTAIAQYARNISTAVTQLANLGAEKIAIPNISDLGLLPQVIESGVSLQGTLTTLAANYILAHTIDNLEHKLGLDIIEINTFGLTQAIASSPNEFGFSNISDPLIQESNPKNPDEFLFWDDVHFTTQAQGLFADLFEDAINTTTSLTDNTFDTTNSMGGEDDVFSHFAGDNLIAGGELLEDISTALDFEGDTDIIDILGSGSLGISADILGLEELGAYVDTFLKDQKFALSDGVTSLDHNSFVFG